MTTIEQPATIAQPTTTEQPVPVKSAPRAKATKAASAKKAPAATPAKPASRFPEANDLVLELIREHGPCQVGKVRAEWVKRSKVFAALTDRQRKGVIRRAVRKLEATGKVSKTGMLFAIAKAKAKAAQIAAAA